MLKRLGILSLLLLTGWSINSACGRSDQAQPTSELDIVGGSVASDGLYRNYFTSLASLRFDGSHFCGGTLIAANQVLTAAHCLADYSDASVKRSLSVVLGSLKSTSTSGAEVFRVKSYKIHANYDARLSRNDIALITLDGNSRFTPAPLNTDSAAPAVDSVTYVAGWGSTSEGGWISSSLKYTAVNVVSNQSCASAYSSSQITAGNLCAYTRGTDSCQGDSGGPLYSYDGQKMTLVGIVSWGYGCARSGYPGVYTRVSEFY